MSKRCSIYLLGFLLLFAAPLAAATYTVTNTSDSPVTQGSLRWAILQANSNWGQQDTINFNIGGGGFWTIAPQSQLPELKDPAGVLIDGLSQPGAGAGANPPSTATLMIEISGMLAGPAHGIWIQSDNNIVQGLIINQFQGDGIRIEGGIANITADFNLAYCNFVGSDQSGTVDLGNGTAMTSFYAGVHICNVPGGQAMDNTVDASLILGNYAEGVWVEGPKQPGDVGRNIISFNYIGTDITGTMDRGNDHEGVCLSEGTHSNQVFQNLISGNDYDGVGVQGYNNIPYSLPPIQTSNNHIFQNIIGLDFNLNLANPLPNTMHGVAIGEYGPSQWGCADHNTVSQNIIAYNGWDGVAVWEDGVDTTNADSNQITRNAIFFNNGMGIDLENDGITYNDVNDPDTGANEEVNFPVITNVSYASGLTTISGMLDINTNPSLAKVEIFLTQIDPGGHGEGHLYLGTATPNASGNWTFSTTLLAPADFVTATTTDRYNNTSEFCQNGLVPGGPTLYSAVRTIPERLGGVINFSLWAGTAGVNRQYVLLASVSGVQPGTKLPGSGVILPLNWDFLTSFNITMINTPIFSNFMGTMDGLGNASAQFNTLGPLSPGTVGTVLYFAYALANPFDYASNHIAVQVVSW